MTSLADSTNSDNARLEQNYRATCSIRNWRSCNARIRNWRTPASSKSISSSSGTLFARLSRGSLTGGGSCTFRILQKLWRTTQALTINPAFSGVKWRVLSHNRHLHLAFNTPMHLSIAFLSEQWALVYRYSGVPRWALGIGTCIHGSRG